MVFQLLFIHNFASLWITFHVTEQHYYFRIKCSLRKIFKMLFFFLAEKILKMFFVYDFCFLLIDVGQAEHMFWKNSV
jgi:hypothetical protein